MRVYGPDGREYSSPIDAMQAGVTNFSYTPPTGTTGARNIPVFGPTGPNLPAMGQSVPGPNAAMYNQPGLFGLGAAPKAPRGLTPGTVPMGYNPMAMYRGPLPVDALAQNPNLTPQVLGGQENLGVMVDRLGNRIFAPGSMVRAYAKGGFAQQVSAQNDANLADDEDDFVASFAADDAEGTESRRMLTSMPQTRTDYSVSPTSATVRRTSKGMLTDKTGRAKGMAMELEQLSAAKSPSLGATDTESARSQMEALALAYKLREREALDTAKGLMRSTFGRSSLEKPTLQRGKLTKKRFKDGGEAKKARGGEPNESAARRLPAPSLTNASLWADTISRDLFPSSKDGVKRDAARHMLASAIMADKTSPGIAETLGKLYEFKEAPLRTAGHWMGLSNPRADYPVDVHNNALGVSLSRLTSDPEKLAQTVRDIVLRGAPDIQPGRAALVPDPGGRAMSYGAGDAQAAPVERAEGSPKEGEETKEQDLGPAFVTPSSGRGRKRGPLSEALQSGSVVPTMARGAGELPYDILGAPVDLATMAMRPFGYDVQKPVMGSDWIKQKMTQAGIRAPEPTDPTQKGFFTAAELMSNLTNPAGVARRVGPAVESGVRAGAREVGKQVDRAMLEGQGPLARIVPQGSRPMFAAEPGRAAPTPLYTPRPTAEAPFVGRLDQFVSTLGGPVRKDQFLGQLKGKFRDYEIGRAKEALQDLDDAAKVSPSDLLNRIKQKYDPARYRTQVVPPEAGKYYAGMDNPYPDAPLGVVHLIQDEAPEVAAGAKAVKETLESLIDMTYGTVPRSLDDLDDISKNLSKTLTKLPREQAQAVEAAWAPFDQLQRSRSEFSDLYDNVFYPSLSTEFKDKLKAFADANRTETFYVSPEERKGIAQEVILNSMRQLSSKYGADDLSQYAPKLAEGYTGAEGRELLNYVEAAYDPINKRLRQAQYAAADSLREVLRDASPSYVRPYQGQHMSLKNDPNPIAFSRFSEQTAEIPGMGRVKGMYVNELQSDRLDDIRKQGPKGGSAQKDLETLLQPLRQQQDTLLVELAQLRTSNTNKERQDQVRAKLKELEKKSGRIYNRINEGSYSIEESFPGMENSPQVIQQLMAKNAISAAIRRGNSFVAFPGAESAQAQLYEKLPNNLKQVVKDLGPGFEFTSVVLKRPDGTEMMHPAVVWGKEAAGRVMNQGVPFKKGGPVDKNAAFIAANA